MLYRTCLKDNMRGAIVVDALHGFFGSGQDFVPLQKHCEFVFRAWDLLGFGRSASQSTAEVTLDRQLEALELGPSSHLLGYSMGGRLALQWAVRHPEDLQSLVVIGGHPGLREGPQKTARRSWDQKWAEFFEQHSIEDCWRSWSELPLIQDQKNAPESLMRMNVRLSQNPQNLSASMRYFGSGVMPDCWELLQYINAPVLLIAGARDVKYTELVHRMSRHLPSAKVWIQPDAGHAPHFEQPEAVGQVLNDWYSSLYSSSSAK